MVRDCISKGFPEAVFRIVVTHSGVHLLASSTDMSRECNPQTITERLNNEFGSMCDEIKLNKNGLIPCPGTVQVGLWSSV